MKNYIIIILALSAFASCGGSVASEEAADKIDSVTSAKKIKVRAKSLQPEHFEHKIEVSGVVEAKNSAYISPEMGGQVKVIHVKEGQRVQKGNLLISLNSKAQQSQLEELKSAHVLAETIFKKQKELWDQKIGSEVQFLEAKNNVASLESKMKAVQAQIDMAQIKAPFSGIVDEVYLKVGELASPGQRLLDLVNLSQIEISAEVSEAYLQTVNKGDKVTVSFPNFMNMEMEAKIQRKGNIINPANRTFKIVVPIPNKDEQFKPNQLATLGLSDYVSDSSLLLPSIAIRNDLNGDYVFKVAQVKGKTVANRQYVTIGKSFAGKTEVKKGIRAGEKVLVEGFNQVRNGSEITVVD